MTKENFIAIVNYFGEENIMGLSFDNSASITFGKGEFTLANVLIEDIDCVRSIGFDSRGKPFHNIKPLDTVQSFMVRDSNVPIEQYDRISIRG